MPKLSRETATVVDHGPVEDRCGQLAGYTVNFVTFRATIDATPLLKGLPNDQCTAAHWGYVVKGEASYTIDGVEEIYKAGDAFYVLPGHTSAATAGTELLQFSPADELAKVEAVMQRNMKAMMGA